MRTRGIIVSVCCLFLSLGAPPLPAQPAPAPQPDPQVQLMVSQPSIDVDAPVEVIATFDPPVVQPGEKATYRITINALDDSIRWPDEIAAPPQLELRRSARGQVFLPGAGKLRPQSGVNYHVRATALGSFTIPEFNLKVYGRPVAVPAAKLEVVAEAPAAPPPPQLRLEVAETNAYSGQPVKVRVLMAFAAPNLVQGLQQVRLNGDGFLVDQGVASQRIGMILQEGRNVPTYSYETVLTPLVSGKLALSAQAFSAGNQLSGAITIQGQANLPGVLPAYLLLDSDPVTLNVRPLPRAGTLPGFTGAIGVFTCDPPQLSANQVRVGDLVRLVVTFRGEGNLPRFVPPPPPAAGVWQVSAAVPGGAGVGNRPPPPGPPGASTTFSYTMMPLTNGIRATPAIPFSYFDPKRGAYVDLTVPAMPITVLPGVTLGDVPMLADTSSPPPAEEKKLELSALATAPGRTVVGFTPLQMRGRFLLGQLVPAFAFTGLWFWDRRRRFLAQHPGIVLRRRARRALRRERRALEKAARAGDAPRFASVAVSAMRVACAPHYPAEPRALVCRDVLELLAAPERSGRMGEIVRRFFSVTDASEFSAAGADARALLPLQPELEGVLAKLEARL